MKYLSIDIEATGLDEHCLMIEFSAIPFNMEKRTLGEELIFHSLIQCPPTKELVLDPWVKKNMGPLIDKAHQDGITQEEFKTKLTNYLESGPVKKYFSGKITLFGKSLNAIDLPFLNRDLGWDFMRKYFSHKVLDLTSTAFTLIDGGHLQEGHDQSTKLMKLLNMGEVQHTALDDARNTAIMYFKLLDLLNSKMTKD